MSLKSKPYTFYINPAADNALVNNNNGMHIW